MNFNVRQRLAQFIVSFASSDMLDTIKGSALKVIPLGNASLQVKYYEGTATANFPDTVKQFSASPSYNLSIVNTDSTNDLYFSFDGTSVQGHLAVGEYTTLNALPAFVQIYMKSNSTSSTYKMWIW